jgi:hypothetical protein
MLAEQCALTTVLDLLDADRWSADAPAWHDQRVVRQLVQVNQGNRTEVLGCLQCLQ